MAKFSFKCKCFKAGEIGGLDKHNRRLNDNYISKSKFQIHCAKCFNQFLSPFSSQKSIILHDMMQV